MNANVATELRMESRNQMTTLLYQDRVTVVAGQYLCVRTYVADDWRANEHRFQVAPLHGWSQIHNPAGQLTAVPVPLHFDVHQSKRLLDRIRDLLGDQD